MNKNIEKIITFLVLLGLVSGIYNLDMDNLWSIQHNWLSYIGFIIFIAYLVYSVKKAAKIQDQKGL
ncbi:hypothetical protein HX057_15610 [Myroides odoratimimus]|uniref:Uncharacterized protein n=1 Tax=Myroides odoratimimus CCUG 10230 TaxID=883150 RepID=A0ABP2N712_9FLAO|nr:MULTISPECIES: hypothetical protein [Myroides]APA93483.1 hypothetical protein BK054_14865 [Myroides sp. ZB35]EHO06148.1 hypothetical protein HMPREF9712_03211 [Myroides odoratimimus CCUG 10230]EHO09050.1 hypothetical protein HMPREF9714_02023 [Myroides odoratimimus CCUG 12901]EKB06390.1 hypothetical protein HMPREF9711_00762 [Myroides odoratimimus CCUG 3837]MDM1097320.1 hypothetical protein [Myroides odoratimimus]